MIVSVSGRTRDASVAIADAHRVMGVCSQERVTRVKRAGANASGLPDEALDVLLARAGLRRDAVRRIVHVAESSEHSERGDGERIGHHFAHACTAYLTSGLGASAILVCDDEAPGLSVWSGHGPSMEPVDWPEGTPGFAGALRQCAAALGLASQRGLQQFEALARLRPGFRDSAADALISQRDGSLCVAPGFQADVETLVTARGGGVTARAEVAAAVIGRVSELFVELLCAIKRRTQSSNLCLGGALFYLSSINTAARMSNVFERVFVPIDPGDGGLAVGAVCHASGFAPAPVPPFLGPSYSAEQIKVILDNCKLGYAWESDERIAAVAVDALRAGRLVAWFDDCMEWGPRALGARSIFADPRSTYVLENLNRFLKMREPWRGYALCGPDSAIHEHFDGPSTAPFMECDYRPRDPARWAAALPDAEAAVRVQTLGANSLPRMMRMIDAFGAAAGAPVLINSSFNGFHEPIVCSPRDAVRVFYGTGLDVLIIDQFILAK